MKFPLDIRFKILAIASQVSVRDAGGSLVFYVKQKAFKLKEDVVVYADEAQTQPLFRIQADRILDISAKYAITDAAGVLIGSIRREGMRSIWRSHYVIERLTGAAAFTVEEERPWVKLVDGLISEIPLVGLVSGYILHPAYKVVDPGSQTTVLRVVKQPAFLEGLFRIESHQALVESDERLAVLGILMMVLLERQRG
jgi:hypothetical protein